MSPRGLFQFAERLTIQRFRFPVAPHRAVERGKVVAEQRQIACVSGAARQRSESALIQRLGLSKPAHRKVDCPEIVETLGTPRVAWREAFGLRESGFIGRLGRGIIAHFL